MNTLPLNKKKKRVSLDAKKARSGYVFVAPFLIGIVLIYLPILLDSIWFGFYEISAVGANTDNYTWVGLQYYKDCINPDFGQKLLSAIQQLILEVPAIIIFSLFIAVVLNQKMLGRAVFRAIFFIPVIISTGLMESINQRDIMSAAAMEGIEDGAMMEEGGATQIISTLDVENLFENMQVGSELVTYVVQLVNDVYNIINYSGVQMLIFLAGLQSISPSIYEACQIEGATAWETFWKITFPMISPMILVNAIYTIIDSFTRSNNTMMQYIDEFPVSNNKAIAVSWIYFLVIMLIIAIFAGIASTFIFYQKRD